MRTNPFRYRLVALCGVGLLLLPGCAGLPQSRQVYQDPITSVRLHVDKRARNGHSHPARITTEQITQVLSGLRVVPRQGVMSPITMGNTQESPAFSTIEIQRLASQLSRAIEQARPEELVTFYRRVADSSVGLAITSGGFFVRQTHLYVVLANQRTLPSAGMNQNIVAEIDPIDSPLLPIDRSAFRVTFTPALAVVPADEHESWSYIDEGRVVVIDLIQLSRKTSKAQSDERPLER